MLLVAKHDDQGLPELNFGLPARESAQRMAANLNRQSLFLSDEPDDKARRLVVRNGYHNERTVLAAAGGGCRWRLRGSTTSAWAPRPASGAG
jgi:hypothetical protein